jgi:hypothetical protein
VVDWFVSPPINFSSPGKLSLRTQVYAIANTAGPSDYFGIWFSAGIKDPTSGNFVEVVNLTNLASDQFGFWIDTGQIDLPFTTDSGYIAFVYKSTDNWFDIHVDDVLIEVDSSVSLKEEQASHTIRVEIFPNPSNGDLTLQFNSSSITQVELSVFNIIGEQVLHESIGISPDTHELKLDLERFGKGIYFLNLLTEARIQSQKIIVQ